MKRNECSYAFEQYSEQIKGMGMSVRNAFASAEELCVFVCVCVYKLSFSSSQHKSAVDALPIHASAVGCPPCSRHGETFLKVTIFNGDLLVRPICRILISFYRAILKEKCLGHVRRTYTVSS